MVTLEELLCGSAEPTPRHLIQGLLGPAYGVNTAVGGEVESGDDQAAAGEQLVSTQPQDAASPGSKACVRTLSWGQAEQEAAPDSSPSQPAAEEGAAAATAAGFGSCIGSTGGASCCEADADFLNSAATSSLIPLPVPEEGGVSRARGLIPTELGGGTIDGRAGGGWGSWQGVILPTMQQELLLGSDSTELSTRTPGSACSRHCHHPSMASDTDCVGDQTPRAIQHGGAAAKAGDAASKNNVDASSKQHVHSSGGADVVMGDQVMGDRNWGRAAAHQPTAGHNTTDAGANNTANNKGGSRTGAQPITLSQTIPIQTPSASSSCSSSNYQTPSTQKPSRAACQAASTKHRAGVEAKAAASENGSMSSGSSSSTESWQSTRNGRWLAALLASCLVVLLLTSCAVMFGGPQQ